MASAAASNKMPELFASVNTLFAEAEKDFDSWKTSNKSLQSDIDELRKLVRSLTQSANELHNECTKPREFIMKSDPTVKLRAGNTMNKISLWEKQKKVQKQRTDGGGGEGGISQKILPREVKKATDQEVAKKATGQNIAKDCPQTHF